VYRELAAPRATARRLGRHVAVVSSLTKCFGLGWARAGWAVLPAELGEAAMDATTHATGALPPSQAAFGAAGLAHLGALEAARDRAQAGKRALLDAFVEKHARVLSWTAPPPGSVFGFLLDRRGEDLRPRIEAGVASERTIAAPGSFFGHPAGVRIALASPLPRIREGLDRLARVLDLA
jgi:aspartate/methionine/tyrosine aminotransferase